MSRFMACSGCGCKMHRGPSSRPPGEAMCLPCRRAKAPLVHTCLWCGSSFTAPYRGPKKPQPKYCRMDCYSKATSQRMQIRAADDHRVTRTQRENSAPGLTKRQRDKLRRIAMHRRSVCSYCGSAPADTLDHVVPLIRGGTNYEGNLAPACRRCNSSKSGKTVMEWRTGRTLPRMTITSQRNTPAIPTAKNRNGRNSSSEKVISKRQKKCLLCGIDHPRPKYCSQECQMEAAARSQRDRYRSLVGLPVDPNKPTRPRRRNKLPSDQHFL